MRMRLPSDSPVIHRRLSVSRVASCSPLPTHASRLTPPAQPSFTSRHAGIAVAGIAFRQRVVETDRVAILQLLAVHANRLQQHDRLGRVADYAVPVVRRLRVDRPAARKPHVETLAPHQSEHVFAAWMQAVLIEIDRLRTGLRAAGNQVSDVPDVPTVPDVIGVSR